MAQHERQRYFRLQTHIGLHTRRLGILLLGTMLGSWLVASTAVPPPNSNQVIFRPFPPPASDAQPAPSGNSVILPQPPVLMEPELQATILPLQPAVLYDDGRFTSEPNLDVATIQAWLDTQPGQLKSALLTVGDRNMSLAEVIVGQAYLYSLNPKLLLVLLELEHRLVTNPAPEPEHIEWALDYHEEDEKWHGLYGQIRWASRELRRGIRDFPAVTELYYQPDGDEDVKTALPEGLNPASYAVLRVLAQTRTPEEVQKLLDDGTFVNTYTQLFEDPRQPLGPLPEPSEPFLRSPLPKPTYVTSFFDHDYPFLTPNGSLVSWWGRRELEISYDGHDGWDYGLRPPDPVLAAADGMVVWAGNSDDGCGIPARGVVLEHGNGYRTLYWHLSEIGVKLGQPIKAGEPVGIVGATGCAFGPHLHFQTQYLGRNTDPYGWCSADADPWAEYSMGMASRWLWADRPNPCALPESAVAVMPGQTGFSTTGNDWKSVPIGAGSETLWTISQSPIVTNTSDLVISDFEEPTPTVLPKPPAVATWRPALTGTGRYRLLAYIPYYLNGHDDATTAKYTIFHAEGTSNMVVNQFVYANDWINLGTYTFDPTQDPRVELSNETAISNQGVWAGTLLWIPE